jgi:bacteriorhodopsin
MSTESKPSTTAMAVVVAFLGAAILLIVATVDGPQRWYFAGLAAVAMIAFLIPVLRSVREEGRP